MLPDCLASVRGVADEVVLVDTGSRDATRGVARAAGAQVHERPWDDDFAAPRNLALAHARGDFVLVLDADERLADRSRATLRRIVDEGGDFDCGMLRLHNATRGDAPADDVLSGAARAGAPEWLPRLLRRTDDLRYTGIVHESVREWLSRRGERLRFLDVDVVHLGAVPSLRAARGKRERNLRLLRKRAAAEPGDPTALGYLANELLEEGRLDEARTTVDEAWALRGTCGPRRGRSILRIAVSRARLQLQARDATGLVSTVEEAARIEGPHPDLAFLGGYARETQALAEPEPAERRALLDIAAASYAAACASRGAPLVESFVEGAASWGGSTRLGTVLLLLGRPGEALAAFERALTDRPDHHEALLGRAEALLDGRRAAEALAAVEPLLDGRPDGWLLASAAAAALGATSDARLLLVRAREREPAGFLAPHRRGRLRALAG